jgi:hypothetical protein
MLSEELDVARGAGRPGPWLWLGYAAGRTMPDRLQGWVRCDLVGPGADVRHVLRYQLLFSPIYVAFLALPGPLYVRVLMILMSVLLGAFYTLSYMVPNRRRRLEQHGLAADLVPERTRRREAREREDYEKAYR